MTRWIARTVPLLALVAAALVVPTGTSPAAAATSATTVLAVQGVQAFHLGYRAPQVFSPVTVVAGGTHVSATGATGAFLLVATAAGERFTAGTELVGSPGPAELVRPGALAVEYRDPQDGHIGPQSFVVRVREATYSGTTLTALALDIDVPQALWPGAIVLRWNSAVPWTTLTPQATPQQDLRLSTSLITYEGRQSDPTTLTWTNRGTTTDVLGTARMTKPYVSIGADSCSGASVAPGASCSIVVRAACPGAGAFDADLVIPDASLAGEARMPVTCYDRQLPVPTVDLVADRGQVTVRFRARPDFPQGYRVRRSPDGGRTWTTLTTLPVGTTGDRTYVDTTGVAGTTYLYAVNAWVESASEPVHGKDGTATGSPRRPATGNAGTYTPVDPERILDTRTGNGAERRPLSPGGAVDLQVTGRAGVPSTGVAAVVLNLTATEPTATTYLTAWPAGTPRPTASVLNVEPGQTRPNLVTVAVGAGGKVSLYNNLGSTHLVADVQGFYSTAGGPAGSAYNEAQLDRLFDSRLDEAPLEDGEIVDLDVDPLYRAAFGQPVPVAVTLNVTVTGAEGSGHITVWPGDGPVPGASNLNFRPGQTVANSVTVPVSYDEEGVPLVSFTTNDGRPHVIVDIVGYYNEGGRALFEPVTPKRVLDTRSGTGTTQRLTDVCCLAVDVRGTGGAEGAMVNLTALSSSHETYLALGPGLGRNSQTSTLNVAPGETSVNSTPVRTLVPTFVAGRGTADLVVDVMGYFY